MRPIAHAPKGVKRRALNAAVRRWSMGLGGDATRAWVVVCCWPKASKAHVKTGTDTVRRSRDRAVGGPSLLSNRQAFRRRRTPADQHFPFPPPFLGPLPRPGALPLPPPLPSRGPLAPPGGPVPSRFGISPPPCT